MTFNRNSVALLPAGGIIEVTVASAVVRKPAPPQNQLPAAPQIGGNGRGHARPGPNKLRVEGGRLLEAEIVPVT